MFAAGVVEPIDTTPANDEVALTPVISISVEVAKAKFAKRAARLVEDAVVAKNEVVVAPVRVSTEKMDDEAAFKMLKARPLSGVWMVEVAP